jgi:DNA-binding CsgD family transcriptional regulator
MVNDAGRVDRAVSAAGTDTTTVCELGGELSRLVGRLVPHDAYLLTVLDPVTGAGCLRAMDYSFSAATQGRLLSQDPLSRDRRLSGNFFSESRPVRVLSSTSPGWGGVDGLHAAFGSEGFGSQMFMALSQGTNARGMLTLLRAHDRTAFKPADATHAGRLRAPLARAVERFVTAMPLRPAHDVLTPGVVVVGHDNTIKGITPSARTALQALWPNQNPLSDIDLCSGMWNVTYVARRTPGLALSRIPTARGWVAMHAQPLDATESTDVAVTIQPATGAVFLPAIAAWYGITPTEQAVTQLALDGLATKHIARRLEVSVHTVHDHFKSIYRKTGLTGREELLAGL